MPLVAKDIKLKKKERVPNVIGRRVPEADIICPNCAERGRETITFAYRQTVDGKLQNIQYCPWEGIAWEVA